MTNDPTCQSAISLKDNTSIYHPGDLLSNASTTSGTIAESLARDTQRCPALPNSTNAIASRSAVD